MHEKLDVGGSIATVTIQTDTSKPRQVAAPSDSREQQWEVEGERETCTEGEEEHKEEGCLQTNQMDVTRSYTVSQRGMCLIRR